MCRRWAAPSRTPRCRPAVARATSSTPPASLRPRLRSSRLAGMGSRVISLWWTERAARPFAPPTSPRPRCSPRRMWSAPCSCPWVRTSCWASRPSRPWVRIDGSSAPPKREPGASRSPSRGPTVPSDERCGRAPCPKGRSFASRPTRAGRPRFRWTSMETAFSRTQIRPPSTLCPLTARVCWLRRSSARRRSMERVRGASRPRSCSTAWWASPAPPLSPTTRSRATSFDRRDGSFPGASSSRRSRCPRDRTSRTG